MQSMRSITRYLLPVGIFALAYLNCVRSSCKVLSSTCEQENIIGSNFDIDLIIKMHCTHNHTSGLNLWIQKSISSSVKCLSLKNGKFSCNLGYIDKTSYTAMIVSYKLFVKYNSSYFIYNDTFNARKNKCVCKRLPKTNLYSIDLNSVPDEKSLKVKVNVADDDLKTLRPFAFEGTYSLAGTNTTYQLSDEAFPLFQAVNLKLCRTYHIKMHLQSYKCKLAPQDYDQYGSITITPPILKPLEISSCLYDVQENKIRIALKDFPINNKKANIFSIEFLQNGEWIGRLNVTEAYNLTHTGNFDESKAYTVNSTSCNPCNCVHHSYSCLAIHPTFNPDLDQSTDVKWLYYILSLSSIGVLSLVVTGFIVYFCNTNKKTIVTFDRAYGNDEVHYFPASPRSWDQESGEYDTIDGISCKKEQPVFIEYKDDWTDESEDHYAMYEKPDENELELLDIQPRSLAEQTRKHSVNDGNVEAELNDFLTHVGSQEQFSLEDHYDQDSVSHFSIRPRTEVTQIDNCSIAGEMSSTSTMNPHYCSEKKFEIYDHIEADNYSQ